MIEVVFACPACGEPVESGLEPAATSAACARCGHLTDLPEAGAIAAAGRVETCCVCASQELFSQRDFNRPLGLTLAGIGLVLGPFTYWISTVVAVVVDAALYLVVPSVVICYACSAQYRGVEASHRPGGFDIAVHDKYKFGRRFPPRRDLTVAGPLARRQRREGKR